MYRLTTKCIEFDDLLGGGFEPGTLTELIGESGAGKTQLCHQLCVNTQLSYEQGGLEGEAYYIDTNDSFRPERIIQMAIALDLDPNEVLDNILVNRAFNSNHQISLIKKASEIIPQFNVKLLILDNIINYFLSEYTDQGMPEILSDILRSHLNDLQQLVDTFPSLVIVFVNHIKRYTDDAPKIPLGGNIIAHASTTRLCLSKGPGEERYIKLIKSPYLSEGETIFCITEDGIY